MIWPRPLYTTNYLTSDGGICKLTFIRMNLLYIISKIIKLFLILGVTHLFVLFSLVSLPKIPLNYTMNFSEYYLYHGL